MSFSAHFTLISCVVIVYLRDFLFQPVLVHWVHCTLNACSASVHSPSRAPGLNNRNLLLYQWVREG